MTTQNLGALRGRFSISSDGAAVYQIPLPLPPGTAGMAPALSLVYNSGGPNGILGMGWQLAGLSTISRVGQTPAQDGAHGAVSYDDNDRFTLDGTRLMAVQGNYGDADAVYRTEIERWAKVMPTYGSTPNRSGPDSFKVITKTGSVQEFGTTADSQVVASSDNPSIRVWALSRSTDRNGNFMTVTYNTADGVFAPARIDYTGNGDDVQPQRSVVFTYEERPDPFTRYVGGYPVYNTQRLTTIDVFVTLQGTATKVLTYVFAYQIGTGTTACSQLQSVTQCDGAGNTLSPTVFEWQQGTAQPLSSPVAAIQNSAPSGSSLLPFDIAGSGCVGLINAYPDPNNTSNLAVDLYMSSPAGPTGPVATPVAQNNVPAGAALYPVDVDGNGCTDLVCATEDTNGYLTLTVFTATAAQGTWNLQLAGEVGKALPTSQVPGGADLYPADVDGDGATDFVAVSENTDNTAQFTVLSSNKDGSYTAQTPVSFPALDFGGQCIPLDVDGDGQTDIVYAYPGGSNHLQLAVLRSNGTSLQADSTFSPNPALNYEGALMPLDVNGDGLVDLVYAASDGTNAVLTVLINTGAGFVQQPSQTIEAVPFVNGTPVLAPGDMNGNGMTDLTAAVANADGSAQLVILLSTGTGFTPAPSLQPVPNAASPQMFATDFAGVGMSGIIILSQTGDVLSIAPTGAFPDLMLSATDGLGGQYAMTYKPLTDPSVYAHTAPSLNPLGMLAGGSQGAGFQPSTSTLQAGSAAAVAPARIVTVPRYVPASYVKSDGTGGNYTYSCNYSNAKIDVAGGRGWLGFATQTCFDADVGSFSVTTFGQDFPLTGTVISHSISRASDQALMFQSTLTPQVLQPHPNVAQVVVAQNQTQLYTFGRLDRTRVVNTNKFDECGNPLTVSDQWDPDGTALYTTSTFNNDIDKWIIGQPTGVTQAADAANTQILTQWQKEYDPTTGNLKRHKVWHDQTSVWLTTTYNYDQFGNCVSEVDAGGNETDYTYDPVFNTFLTATTEPPTDAKLRLTRRYEYEPVFGTVSKVTDANGVASVQQIDGFGHVSARSATDPQGNVVQVTKIAMGQDAGGIYRETQTALDWTGKTWTWRREYLDGLNRVYRTVTLGADGKMEVTVDRKLNSKNQVTSQTLPYVQGPGASPLAIASTYDALSRITQTTRPADAGATSVTTSVTTFDYPDVSTTVQTEAAGSGAPRSTTTIHGTFNGKSRVLTVTDPTNATTTFAYDPLGQLKGVTDAAATLTSMSYDSLGQKTGFTTNAGTVLRSEANKYDLVARVVTTTDSRGKTVTHTRDALGRQTSKTDSDGNLTTFEYDTAPHFGLRRLAKVTMPDGSGYAFDYDPAGNQTSITTTIGGQAYTFARSFLPSGKVQQQTFPDGAVQTNSYTPGGRLSSITIVEGGATKASLSFADYNAFGKPGTITNGNGVTETLIYNPAGQLHEQAVGPASGPLSDNVFAWNLFDDLESIKDQLDPTQGYSFVYDAAGRLKEADGPYPNPQSFEYDDATGNLTNKAGMALQYKNGVLQSAGATAIQYDAAANIAAMTADGTTTKLAYDSDGWLSQAGNSSFTYDYMGRRLSKSTPRGTTTFYVAPDYEVTKLPNGGLQHTKYLRSPLGLGASITTADQPGAGAAAPLPGVPTPGVCYFHRNQVNSTTLVTDGTGAAQARVSYLPFGEIASLTGSDTFRAKFGGRELDEETGLSYFGARYYAPGFGRFVSPDDRLGGPLGLRDIANTYAYVLNSPICHVDPTGHDFLGIASQAMGGALGSVLVSGFESIGEQAISTAKVWAPYAIDGVLIVGGVALIASGAGAVIGTGLFVAGLTGLNYTIQAQMAGNFSWEHWGVQVGIGYTVGSVGALGGAAVDSMLADYMLGGAARIGAMALMGAATGAAGAAYSTYMTNLDYGRSGTQGIGWATVVGAGTGALGSGASEGLSGTGSFSDPVEPPPGKIDLDDNRPFELDADENVVSQPPRRVLKPGLFTKFVVKSQPLWFGIGGKAIIGFGPQWTW